MMPALSSGGVSESAQPPSFAAAEPGVAAGLEAVNTSLLQRADVLDGENAKVAEAVKLYKSQATQLNYAKIQQALGGFLMEDKKSRIAVANAAREARADLANFVQEMEKAGANLSLHQSAMMERRNSLVAEQKSLGERLLKAGLSEADLDKIEDLPIELQKEAKKALNRNESINATLALIAELEEHRAQGNQEVADYQKYISALDANLDVLEAQCLDGLEDLSLMAGIIKDNLDRSALRSVLERLSRSAAHVVSLPFPRAPSIGPRGIPATITGDSGLVTPGDKETLRGLIRGASTAAPKRAPVDAN